MWGSNPLVMIISYLLNISFLLAIGLTTKYTYVQSIVYNCTVVEGKYIYSILHITFLENLNHDKKVLLQTYVMYT